MIWACCVLCGENDPDKMEVHHMVPRAMGGTDDRDNVVSVCSPCHARIHEFGIRRGSMRELQAEGIARAKAEGKFKGRVPTAKRQAAKVLELLAQRVHCKQIAEQCGIGIASVYRIRQTRGSK